MLSQSTFRRIEYRLFCSIILLNVILLFTTKFYPTMDGPSHLYNVEVIKQLIAGNETIAEFFDINPIAIPNWTGHFLLLLFRFFAPSWLAEKFLISLYIIMLPVSFRMLVRKLSGSYGLSVLILPFVFNLLFHMGFYNYSLSFIFFFLAGTCWLNTFEKPAFFRYLVCFLFLLLIYFSAILTFFVAGMLLGALTLTSYLKHKSISRL